MPWPGGPAGPGPASRVLKPGALAAVLAELFGGPGGGPAGRSTAPR
jgi:hypothetical protein